MEAIHIKATDRHIYDYVPQISGGVLINHWNHCLKQFMLGKDPEKATSRDIAH